MGPVGDFLERNVDVLLFVFKWQKTGKVCNKSFNQLNSTSRVVAKKKHKGGGGTPSMLWFWVAQVGMSFDCLNIFGTIIYNIYICIWYLYIHSVIHIYNIYIYEVQFPLLTHRSGFCQLFDLRILEPIASMFKMSCIISNRLQETRGLLPHCEWTDMLLPGVIQSMVAIAATWMSSDFGQEGFLFPFELRQSKFRKISKIQARNSKIKRRCQIKISVFFGCCVALWFWFEV